MLPLWRDQVLIVIAPTYISLVRLRGWFGKRQVIAKYSQKFSPAQDSQIIWQPGLEALAICLRDSTWQKASARVVLTNSLVRFTLLPWSDAILSPVEEQKFVKFRMDEVFGVTEQQLEISLAAKDYGHSRLACAVDADLLSSLRQLALKSHLRIQSIQPHFIAALNFWREELKGEQLYFLLSDGEKLGVTYIKDGHIQSLRLAQMDGVLSDEMVIASLQRENLMNHQSNIAIQAYLFTSEKTSLTRSAHTPYKLQYLNLPSNYMNRPAAFLAVAPLI